MIEVRGNFWTYPADVRVIATNGTVKPSGECVMERGYGTEAEAKFPNLPALLGKHIKEKGNVVSVPMTTKEDDGSVWHLVSFPIKHNWWGKADPYLIAKSSNQLVSIAGVHGWGRIVLPRPACGFGDDGRLRWENVKKLLILPDKFHVITAAGTGIPFGTQS